MDVQAATATLGSTVLPPPLPSPGDGSTASPPAPPAGVAPIGPSATAPPTPGDGSQSSGPKSDPTPGLALLPPSSTTTNGNGQGNNGPTLPGDVAKLYNASENDVSVSFQVSRDGGEVVTVFTDKQTGKVIVQFPSETLIALAQFFQKLNAHSDAGAVVNRKA